MPAVTTNRRIPLAAALVTTILAAGCASAERAPEAPTIVDKIFPEAKGTGLDGLDEKALAAALSRPVELELPARLLVVDFSGRDVGQAVADALQLSPFFVAVPALRELQLFDNRDEMLARLRLLAVRYRTPYVLLTNGYFTREEGPNVLSPLYAGLVTYFFVPGLSIEVRGRLEMALLDVRTGTILYGASRAAEGGDLFVRFGDEWESQREVEREIIAREAKALATLLENQSKRALDLGTLSGRVLAPGDPRPAPSSPQ
jgi:hypothetical protein